MLLFLDPSRIIRRAHDAPDGRAGRKRKPEIRLAAFGAGTKNRPVERREAQRPAGRPRKPAGFLGARASRAGFANPSVWRATTEPRRLRQGVSQAPGASRRSMPPPYPPPLAGEGRVGGNEKSGRRTRRLANNTGGGALAESKETSRRPHERRITKLQQLLSVALAKQTSRCRCRAEPNE